MGGSVRLIAFLLARLASTPALADCKTAADDVVRYDRRIKEEANEFENHYGDSHIPTPDDPVAVRQHFVSRLDSLIDAMRGDIDGLKWLIAHHCGPADEEPNAIKSVRDMPLILIGLITRRMNARALR
jgi:hypothetical protein